MSQCYVLWLYFNLNTADQCIVHHVTTDKIDKHNIDCNSISVSNEYELNFALHTQEVQVARQRGSGWFSLLLQAYTNQSIKNGKASSYTKNFTKTQEWLTCLYHFDLLRESLNARSQKMLTLCECLQSHQADVEFPVTVMNIHVLSFIRHRLLL